MIFYSDRRDEYHILQFGVNLWNDTTISISIPTALELWTNVTRAGYTRTALFGFDIVEKDYRRAVEITILFVLFGVEWGD